MFIRVSKRNIWTCNTRNWAIKKTANETFYDSLHLINIHKALANKKEEWKETMKNSKFALSILFFGLAVILLFGSLSPATATINATYNVNTDEIQNLLDQYFQLRYESRKNNVIPDLSHFIAVNFEKARNFLSKEIEKSRLESLNANKNDLEYLDYKFMIDIQSVDFNSEDSTVTVVILENHEVVFKKSPNIISKMNNLVHPIILSPNGQLWKIIDDTYDDFL